MKITLAKINIADDYDGALEGVGDIHVQYKFSSNYGGGSGVDGIDYGEWQLGHNTSVLPGKVLKAYMPQYDDVTVCLYDDDPASIGRGSGDLTGSDDIIENVAVNDLTTKSGTYTMNNNTSDGGYVQLNIADDTPNQSGYADYAQIKYSPHVVQPDIDRNGGNKVLAVLYDPPSNNTITYYIIYQDEDHPALDQDYDETRLQQWKRIEDVEWVKVHYAASGVDWVQLKYGGGQAYTAASPNDNDVRYFYKAQNQIQFNGTHPKIYVATWNHLHDVKARTDQSWSWGGTYNLLLIDGTGMNKDFLTIVK